MRYWLVRVDAPSVFVQDRSFLTITASRRATIQEGDELIFVTDSKDQGRFAWKASALQVTSERVEDYRAAVVTKVALQGVVELSSDAEIGLLKFSLGFVWNLEKPWLHFRRGYRLLPRKDFDVIVAGTPFIARTVYYELFEALPKQLRAQFQASELMLAVPAGSFLARLQRLGGFIQERVVAASNLIVDLKAEIDDLRLDINKHVLAAEAEAGGVDESSLDDIGIQALMASEFKTVWKKVVSDATDSGAMDLVTQFVREVGQPSIKNDQDRFEVLFRGIA